MVIAKPKPALIAHALHNRLHLGFPVWLSGGSFIQLSKEVDMRADRLAEVVKRALLVGMLQLGYICLAQADTTILNVSYDSTRKLYKEFNAAFAEKWQADTGETTQMFPTHQPN